MTAEKIRELVETFRANAIHNEKVSYSEYMTASMIGEIAAQLAELVKATDRLSERFEDFFTVQNS